MVAATVSQNTKDFLHQRQGATDSLFEFLQTRNLYLPSFQQVSLEICLQNSLPVSARGGGGEGGGHSLVSSVPMRDQKNDEKGYFFSRTAVRSADII